MAARAPALTLCPPTRPGARQSRRPRSSASTREGLRATKTMSKAPQPEVIDRAERRNEVTQCCGLFRWSVPPKTTAHKRPEQVFYDSAVAKRTCIGRIHYCVTCPGWSKATSMRVVYSRWDMVPLAKLPSECAKCCCDCGGSQADWMPPPDPRCFQAEIKSGEGEDCCSWSIPCGRTLDTFDADIIVDASAHQTLCQICRDEGDLVLYRKAGADLSDSSEVFVLPDVVRPFDVFNDVTFELSKINLQGATTSAMGSRMGATVWNFDARSGADGPATSAAKPWRGAQEEIYYDSLTARRTCLGSLCQAPCCCPPIYKVTSERVLFTEWDYFYPCDDPFNSLGCCVCWAGRACAREFCCAIGASTVAAERRAAKLAAKNAQPDEANSGCCGAHCCAVPVGRTAHFFDIDIVADVRAHQSCWQLVLNEGSLHFGRMAGGDASHNTQTSAFFNVKCMRQRACALLPPTTSPPSPQSMRRPRRLSSAPL